MEQQRYLINTAGIILIIIILTRKRRRDSMTFLRLMCPQLSQYNHKQLQFITAAYALYFVAMWLLTFDLGAGLENPLHLASLMKCDFVKFVRT